MGIEVRPMKTSIGAEISGVVLSRPVNVEEAAVIRQAWLDHQVLVFHAQDINAEDQRRLVSCFGELQSPRSKIQRANPDILYVANVTVDGDQGQLPEGDMEFHTDQCYYESRTAGAVLYAIEVPSRGGNTMFADTYGAYEALSPALKRRLDGLDILFVYDYETNAYHRGNTAETAPRCVHPAVIRHPGTGRPALFVNRLMADSVVGLPKAESDALLAELFDHVEQRRFIYEHAWSKHDIVVWDNFSSLHARTDFDPAERRVLRRMAIRGTRPAAYRLEAAAAVA
jgi:taurine dioxygenase